jgi:arginyl-tRNA---protein transferase
VVASVFLYGPKVDIVNPPFLKNWVYFQDLVDWEEFDIYNPQSIKGIVGELAAVLGPELVQWSAVVLFD